MKLKSKFKFNLAKFIFCIIITESAGILGSFTTVSSVKTWYPLINKPSFNPPSWLFAPVWTLLFFLMGVALYLVWSKKNKITWFWIQLLLNILWSFLFFGLHLPWLAFIEIIFLCFTILITIIKFWAINKKAAILLIPYLAWVTFASFLNFTIARLN